MRDYELTVLLKSTLSEKETDKVTKTISEVIEKAGGKVTKKVDPAKKPLAYEVAKAKDAYYVYFEISLEPSSVSAVDQKLRLTDEVIRFLLCQANH